MTSKATKRKHVIKEVLDDFVLPEEGQEIVKMVSSRGSNLHEVWIYLLLILIAVLHKLFLQNIVRY